MTFLITDLAARAENGSPSPVVLGIVILVLFTVTFAVTGIITYKMRVRKFREKQKDENSGRNEE